MLSVSTRQTTIEKLVQIQLMGDIYSLATKVIIWLGPSNGKTTMLNEFYQKFYDILLDQFARHRSVRIEAFSHILRDTSLKQQQQFLNELSRLLLMSWWNRKWTYQEALLAQFPNLMCGDWVYHMNLLRLMLAVFSSPLGQKSETVPRFAALMQRYTAHATMRLAAEMP